ncbi:MAG: Crp/Fnr family transcriptional regulator [Gammaproteobacteria bacterium]|nr:Crp/Fnr family transcriptional regulator [Gammaproteobacteria bacterium]
MADGTEKRLAAILQMLPAAQAEALLEFAEFLLMRHGVAVRGEAKNVNAVEIPAPLDIPRPSGETVVKAVKRLRATYPMLDARILLNQTSELMTQHLVQGRETVEVIEELEILFRSHYEKLVVNNKD